MLLLDAGVWVASVAPEEPLHREALALLKSPERDLAALDLTLYEVVNVIAGKRSQPREAEQLGRFIISRCKSSTERVGVDLVAATTAIAAEHGLTAYDAAYVAAARRNAWTLVSTDVADLVSKGLAVTPDAALYP
jgi:predicted nucleic acid-binding protein